jgi:hypothetical protein
MQAATSDSTSRTNSSAAQSATVNADGTVSDDGTGDNERHITYECDRACGDTLVTFWENGHAVGNHWMTGVCFNGTMQLD